MRLAKGSMDSATADKYYGKANICKNKLIELCDNNSDVLRLDKARISLRGVLSVDNVGKISVKPASVRNYNNNLSSGIGKAHYDTVHDIIDKCTDTEVASMWSTYENEIKYGGKPEEGEGAHARGKSIYIDMDIASKGSRIDKPYQVVFHEGAHVIDKISRNKIHTTGIFASHFSGAYKDGLFPQTIKDEVMAWVNRYDAEIKKAFKEHAGDVEWFYNNKYIRKFDYDNYKAGWDRAEDIIPKYKKELAYNAVEKELLKYDPLDVADLCDMVEGATSAKISCVAGHGKKYWADRTISGISDGLATEAFAEMTDSTMANSKSLELIKKHLPKSYDLYKEMVKEILDNG